MDLKTKLRKIWHFIWEEDSFLSWVVNIVLAFLLVKFIIYPGLGLLLGTGYPVVAVVSCSMEHNLPIGGCSLDHTQFDSWFSSQKDLYEKLLINRNKFLDYRFMNGFNKGDLIVLTGYGKVNVGDVIVFRGASKEPIIHRVVRINNINGKILYHTKGDNNNGSRADELDIGEDRYVGKAVFRIPYLGWVKLAFMELLQRVINLN